MVKGTARGFGPDVQAPALSANATLPGMEVFVDLAELIDIPPDFRIEPASLRIEYSYDFPLISTEFDALAEAGSFESPGDGTAHDDFP